MKAVSTKGNSMWPALKTGDIALVEPAEEFQPGDLVLVFTQGIEVAHRYLAPGIIKGDRLSSIDSGLDPGTSILKIKAVLPRRFARKPQRKIPFVSTNPPLLQWLSQQQARLSRGHGEARSKVPRHLILAALICNGFAIRCTYYAMASTQQAFQKEH